MPLTTRIGPKMAYARALASGHRYGLRAVAFYRELGPRGSVKRGLEIARRAERAGLIRRERNGAVVRFFALGTHP